ncbi:hypothetical protein A2U01_0081274, partial [Trifolium medium]|nr:hypothetical protein [Trifolium medium]
ALIPDVGAGSRYQMLNQALIPDVGAHLEHTL